MRPIKKHEIERRELIRKLYEEGLFQREIAKRFGVSQKRISQLLRKAGVPPRLKNYWATRVIPLDESPHLAYLAGLIFGDGSITNIPKLTYKVQFINTNSKLLDTVEVLFKELGLVPYRKKRDKKVEVVICYNKSLTQWLLSLTYEKLYHWFMSDTEAAINFLRGLYETEGYLRFHNGRYEIRIGNTKMWLLDICKQIIMSLGLNAGIYKHTRAKPNRLPCYALTLYDEDVKQFLLIAKPLIKNELRNVPPGDIIAIEEVESGTPSL